MNDAGWCVRHNSDNCTCSSSARRRASGTSVDAKLATWGDVPGQSDIFEQIAETDGCTELTCIYHGAANRKKRAAR